MKRIQNKRRAKQRAEIVQPMTKNLLDNLARIEEGKTPPEIVDAHVDYYFSCNNAEKLILQDIFAKREDKMQTEICHFFAEKDNE